MFDVPASSINKIWLKSGIVLQFGAGQFTVDGDTGWFNITSGGDGPVRGLLNEIVAVHFSG